MQHVTRRPRSGRTVARIGLRMMPPFPQSPLSTVRRVFPSTAGRLAFQVAPSPMSPRLSQHQACPAHHVGLRLPFVHSVASSWCRDDGLGDAPPFEELTPLPQRSSLRSGLYCPSPSTLIRPHPSHSQAHPDFTAWRFIRDAFAVLVRLGDPRLVPCFCCSFLIDMPPSTTPGSPSAAFAQFFANGTSLRHNISDSALPFTPSSASDGK